MNKRVKVGIAGLALFFLGLVSGQALAKQPHMQAALDALNVAQNQLNQAASDKGGHRANALGFIQQAKDEVKAGMAYAAP